MKVVYNGTIYTGENVLTDHGVLIKGKEVVGLIPESQIPEDCQRIDAEGNMIAPGLVDLQIYGWGDKLFANRPSSEYLADICQSILKTGTTSFILTLATNTLAVFKQSIEVVKNCPQPALLGLHLEGPYLNQNKRGAHPAGLIRKPVTKEISDLLQPADGVVKMMTIAPERFSSDAIHTLLEYGVLLSAGHSNATYEEAMIGFDQGVRAVTHLYNAMSRFHHRDPGLPGATMNRGGVFASIIADGIHVNYHTIAITKKMMGERLFLITDAVAASTGGIYQHSLNVDHYELPDGTLSGSALSLLQAVRNCVTHVGLPIDEALRMATLYPARVANADKLGRITPGSIANIIVFDTTFDLQQVIYEGVSIQT